MPDYTSINLHPSSHNPSSLKSTTYDVVVLGSGWAGRIVAARVVKAGLSAIIIEEELVGGDCPFWACVPSKVLLRSQEALDEANAVGGVRERIASNTWKDARKPHASSVFERRDMYTSLWDDSKMLIPMVESSGATLVRGTGMVTGVKKVRVKNFNGETVDLQARLAVVICTGSEPLVPSDVPGLIATKPWGSRQAASSSDVPAHLVILGAGAVGTEMATAYSSLGSKVSLVSSSPEVLSKVDSDAGKLVREALIKQGVTVYTLAKATSVTDFAYGLFTVDLSDGKKITGATKVLLAMGRTAKTAGIGLEQFGIKTDGTPIPVDESLCVSSVPGGWLYALGDVNGRATTTHSSKYHGRIGSNAIIDRAKDLKTAPLLAPWSSVSATADVVAQPQVIFTNPQVATVGLTRASARASKAQFREVTAPLATLGAKIHADGYEDGWAQWIVEEQSNKLLGATFVGSGIADLLHASTVAIVGGMTLDKLAHAVPPFPTMSEVYLNLLEAAGL